MHPRPLALAPKCAARRPTPSHGVTPLVTRPPATRRKVREGYAAIARASDEATQAAAKQSSGCCEPSAAGDVKSSGGCCGARTDAAELAREIGYSESEIALLPEGANMGLSCGNP